MSYESFTIEELADYLHLSRTDIEGLVKRREIPFEMRGERHVFPRNEVDAWASERILGLKDRRLTEYHQKTTQSTRQLFRDELVMPGLLLPEFIAPALAGKTKASVLREMVAVAETTGRLYNPKDLQSSLTEREDLCSTAIPGGMALLHARQHLPYMFESSFIVLGRTLNEIFFGAPDGRSTDLFFLICCQDDRIHLHTLARICLMAMKTELLDQLRQASDAAAMYECVIACEKEVMLGKPTT